MYLFIVYYRIYYLFSLVFDFQFFKRIIRGNKKKTRDTRLWFIKTLHKNMRRRDRDVVPLLRPRWGTPVNILTAQVLIRAVWLRTILLCIIHVTDNSFLLVRNLWCSREVRLIGNFKTKTTITWFIKTHFEK